MSTCNFSPVRNSRNFPVFLLSEDYDAYCADSRDQGCTPCDFSDWYDEDKAYYIGWLREQLEATFGADNVDYYRDRDVYDGDDVADVYSTFTFAGIVFSVTLKVVLHAGYFEGFTLDHELSNVDGEFEYIPDEEDAAGLLNRAGLNPGLAKMLRRAFIAHIENAIQTTADGIDRVFAKVAPHNWRCLGILCNGEGVYEECAPTVA